eukprot:2046095-Prymnesium_polylepis.1
MPPSSTQSSWFFVLSSSGSVAPCRCQKHSNGETTNSASPRARAHVAQLPDAARRLFEGLPEYRRSHTLSHLRSSDALLPWRAAHSAHAAMRRHLWRHCHANWHTQRTAGPIAHGEHLHVAERGWTHVASALRPDGRDDGAARRAEASHPHRSSLLSVPLCGSRGGPRTISDQPSGGRLACSPAGLDGTAANDTPLGGRHHVHARTMVAPDLVGAHGGRRTQSCPREHEAFLESHPLM